MGLAHVKEALVDNDERRKELAELFTFSQTFMQDDPWAERAQGGEAHEFTPIKVIA